MIFEKAESLASMKPFPRKQNPAAIPRGRAKHTGFHGLNWCQQPSCSMEFHCPEGMSHLAPTLTEALPLGLIRKIINSLQGHFQNTGKSLLIETK